MREAVIVSAVRTPVGKAPRGSLKEAHPVDYGALVVREAIRRAPGLAAAEVDDLVLACAMPEGEAGLNAARHVALKAGLSEQSSAMTINRFCASGLQALAIATQQVGCGTHDIVVAAGTESMTLIPAWGTEFSPDPELVSMHPDLFLGMGLTAENVAERFGVSREDQDAFSHRSHTRAAEAVRSGRFKDEIIGVRIRQTRIENGRPVTEEALFAVDEGVRFDSDLAKMAALKPAFKVGGTVTAGNSSQTSDGAAALVVMSAERASELGLEPLGALRHFATAGVPPEIMGIGPVEAVPKVLKRWGRSLDDIDLIELNEAFAAQVIACVRELGLNEAKLNVNGGAIALGHPLGATGAKLSVQLLYELGRRQARWGLVTMCVGGGQGAAGLIECF
ncbi:MAG: thiolase family protein [Truepera sp.]|nr:thiolase family protein [Truepera sp.]